MKNLVLLLVPILCACASQPALKTPATSQHGAGQAAPSAGAAIGERIKRQIEYVVPQTWDKNEPVEHAVTVFPDGSVRDVRKVSGSGLPEFDNAVRRAIELSQPYPVRELKGAPPGFILISYPRDHGRGRTAASADATAGRPGANRHTVAADKEPDYAAYSQGVLQRVQKLGNLHYHKLDLGKTGGELTIAIPIQPDGSLYMADGGPRVMRSSGNTVLDEQVLTIVRNASPFDALPPGLRSPYKDVTEIVLPFSLRPALTR